ncbi:ABC transporter [Salinarchaeum sp. Harcht-Bsk1]|uniref:ABC transporter permease subunit n=1 Tax=Salinarchaeum sp. Harcht-Bsk1 TaxID=1333523 RepID=UPI00034231FC|nr:ABC transporter permease subunit [Salinarchaeum sp. Harcht-Bsk1]AGN02834.1 ABC transporter [Salinarchaeum sp. Harcht-Bsk1]
MTWIAIARKDVFDAARSKSIWILAGVFLVTFVGVAFAIPRLGEPEFEVFLELSASVVVVLVPFAGIATGYKAIVGERESGTVALLLSLPHARHDVTIGKVVGRSLVVAGPIVLGLVAAAVVVLVRYPTFEPLRYALFVLATLAYGVTFLSIATGLSMTTRSSRRVTGGAFGAYVLLVMFWNQVVDLLVVVLWRFRPRALADPPTWAEFATFANPRVTYTYLVGDVLGAGGGPPATEIGTEWFVSPAGGVMVLLAWIVVPLLLGHRRFVRADL